MSTSTSCFKVRLRKTNAPNTLSSGSSSSTNSSSTTGVHSLSNTKCSQSTKQKDGFVSEKKSFSSSASESLAALKQRLNQIDEDDHLDFTNDSVLKNIVDKLNIPSEKLLTPKWNRTKSSSSVSSLPTKADAVITEELLENIPSYYPKTNNIPNVNEHTNSSCSGTNYLNTYHLQEWIEHKRRLRWLEQNSDFIKKVQNLKITSQMDEEDDDDDEVVMEHQNEESELSSIKTPEPKILNNVPVQSQSKVIRTFSANDSVVEISKDNFEPKYVKEINFEILKLPNSQQSIQPSSAFKEEDSNSFSVLSGKKSSSNKKKRTISTSQEKRRLRQYPAKESSKFLKPLNLDASLALVDNSSSSVSNQPKINSNVPLLEQFSSKSVNSLSVISENADLEHASPIKFQSNQKLTKSLPQLNNVEEVENKQLHVNSEMKNSNSSDQLGRKLSNSSSIGNVKKFANNSESNSSVPGKEVPNLKSLKRLAKSWESKHKQVNQRNLNSNACDPLPTPKLSSSSVAAVKSSKNNIASLSKVDFVSTTSTASTVARNAKTVATNNPSMAIRTIVVKQRSYLIFNKIGRGGSSTVYQIYEPEKQLMLALKVVDLSRADEAVLTGFRNEIELLKRLRVCKRVVRLYDYEFRNGNKELLIVMEKGDDDLASVLKSYFQADKKLLPHVVRFYWQEMLEAVKEIHQKNIVHSDLKPVNFIVVSGMLKLIDFGIANAIQTNKTSVYKDCIIGTVDYMAPESFQKQARQNGKAMVKYNQKADIWSLGIILYNMVYGCTPFYHIKDNLKKGIAIINSDIDYPQIEDQSLVHVIKLCLQRDPNKRPTAAQLLKHKYLTQPSLSSTVNGNPKETSSVDQATGPGSPVSNVNIPAELLSQFNNMTPNSLRCFSRIVEKFGKK